MNYSSATIPPNCVALIVKPFTRAPHTTVVIISMSLHRTILICFVLVISRVNAYPTQHLSSIL